MSSGVSNRGAEGQLPLPKLLGVGSAPPQELKARTWGERVLKILRQWELFMMDFNVIYFQI